MISVIQSARAMMTALLTGPGTSREANTIQLCPFLSYLFSVALVVDESLFYVNLVSSLSSNH